MQRESFYQELMNDVRARSELDRIFKESAFLAEAADRLTDADVVGQLTAVHFTGSGQRQRRLAVSAYEIDESDDSVALCVLHFEESEELTTLTDSDARKQFLALERFVEEALTGTFQAGREESTEEYQLAEELRRRRLAITRYRLYLITNKALSARAKDFPSTALDGTPVEYHVWDVERFHQVFESAVGREDLQIDLTQWAPGGLPALKAGSGDGDTDTFLLVLPARLLIELYGRYGSRLLESNVRSFLSTRGKVNRGIKETVMTQPDRFLAYNNGITATATAVEVDGSALKTVTDLQIVNGGQTTASLFYAHRESKKARQFDEVFVQAKLVVVTPERAQELVPNISRFANSQNKVNEADFFSNSPFHVRLEELSRRVLTPARPGVTFQSKWFYERVRGQYSNEKTRLGTKAEEDRFLATFPKDQVITKTDAAKYSVSWSRKPHLVSAGSQKNFVAFANEASAQWERSSESVNETYFKHLVGKAILYKTIRSDVAKQPWYQSGYLANIVTYTIAKVADTIDAAGLGEYDFEIIWNRQEVSEAMKSFALDVAREVLGVLDSEDRPIANVTEWAKREQCWKEIQALPIELPADVAAETVSASEVQSQKKSARTQQKMDDGIQAQAAVMAIPSAEWSSVQRFAQELGVLSPTEAGILAAVTARPPRIPSERQATRLLELRKRVSERGYDYDSR